MLQFQPMPQMSNNTINEIKNDNEYYWIKMMKLGDNKTIKIPCTSDEKVESIIDKYNKKLNLSLDNVNYKFLSTKEIQINSSLIGNGINSKNNMILVIKKPNDNNINKQLNNNNKGIQNIIILIMKIMKE